MSEAVGIAHGKLILSGEHFVVYGNPSLAIPLMGRRIRVSLAPNGHALPEAVRTHIHRLLEALDVSRSTPLTIQSDIPMGAGLGSSAALAVALVRALEPERAKDLEWLRAQAHRLERLAHGNPSGVDDAVATYATPVFYTRRGGVEPLVVDALPRLWVAVTAERTSTKEAVAQVGELAAREPDWFAEQCSLAAECTLKAKAALMGRQPQVLGEAMNANHTLLQRIGVSTPGLDALVEAARRVGAYGAKLTGGGLGGAVIALGEASGDLEEAFRDAGAIEVIKSWQS